METFVRKKIPPPKIAANLWLAPKKGDQTPSRAAVVLGSPGVASELNAVGFDVLEIASGDLETVQSAVVYLRSNGRLSVSRVALVASGASATGVASYAGSTRQMNRIVDFVVLIDPAPLKEESLRSIYGIPVLLAGKQSDKKLEEECPTVCRTSVYSKPGERNKSIVEFLLKR